MTACPSPACVIVRWQRDRVQDHSRRKAQREGGFVWKRSQSPLLGVYGQSDGSPLRTKSAFGSARAPLARRDVHGNPRISPASEDQRLCAKCLHSSWEESVIRQLQRRRDAAPATFGATKTRLDSSSNSFRPARPHGPLLDEIDRARYRSHSSFVDGRDKHLDASLRQRRAPSFTQRLQGRSRRRPARHK